MAHETAELKQFIREAGDDELLRRLAELKEELFKLRVAASMGGVDNPKRSWFVRKAVARVLTELRRRELVGGEA